VWLASREAAARWREGWRPGKEGTGAEKCTLEGGRPLLDSANGRTRGGRREKERSKQYVCNQWQVGNFCDQKQMKVGVKVL